MANKKVTYQVDFVSNTEQLKKSLDTAISSLNKVGNLQGVSHFSKEMQEAAMAAKQMQRYLQNATTPNGTLDIVRFKEALDSGNITLSQFNDRMLQAGSTGQKAFLNVADAILKTQTPMMRINKQMSELWVSMKNTMQWQLTSSMLHGFMGSLSSCYGYAQDLNKSLTNIRIVSGQSTEQMAEFAKQANAAAQALSTTTTTYTDASLIYYQQGLIGDAVEERAQATIKMANVTGQTAMQVSNQLTAIWNNFYDGTKSLEYYADIITALGAATASSTTEIATGLEKFAAVASSIGLSYEYATAALATVTATTRQSADTVGTALKLRA